MAARMYTTWKEKCKREKQRNRLMAARHVHHLAGEVQKGEAKEKSTEVQICVVTPSVGEKN